MNITEDYVSFEIAKLLKEKGFNEKCRGFYVLHASGEARFCISTSYEEGWNFNKEERFVFAAPTLQMAMKWLRKVHHIYASPVQQGNYNDFSENYTWIVARDGIIYRNKTVSEKLSYEEACEAAIKYALENLM